MLLTLRPVDFEFRFVEMASISGVETTSAKMLNASSCLEISG